MVHDRPSDRIPDEVEELFELSPDLLCIAGFDGYLKRVNGAFERRLGYPRDELLRRPFLEIVHPDDLQGSLDALAGLAIGEDLAGYEHRMVCADGEIIWVSWTTRTMPERGYAFGAARDVTERRRAADETRRLAADLAASRARVVAATHEERRRVVRDLHDGAQQRLVHAVIKLKLAAGALAETGAVDEATEHVGDALLHAERAMVELRELVHGILPSVLTRGGLAAGVRALASRAPVPVEADVAAERLPPVVEATAYFVVAEALTNVAKHAGARHVQVTAAVDGDVVEVQVRDDGAGGARADGTGLVGLADRVAALDGTLTVDSPPGGGTRVTARIPLGARRATRPCRSESSRDSVPGAVTMTGSRGSSSVVRAADS